MLIESVFMDQQPIPKKYTCEGHDISPPLRFIQVPSQTKSLVLIVDDPDAPNGTFDHWIVWNIPPHIQDIAEGAKELFNQSDSIKQGLNGFKALGYHGPCPPPGKVHHYRFRLYALSKELSLDSGAKKLDVEKAMRGTVLDEAILVGTYERK